MDDIAGYCSWADTQLNEDASFVTRLPNELRSIIIQSTGSQHLDSLAHASRMTQYADILFPLYRNLYPELVARWIAAHPSDNNEIVLTVSCLARILPIARHLRQYVRTLLESEPMRTRIMVAEDGHAGLSGEVYQMLLLALFRLLSFDPEILAESSSPMFLSSFLRHPSLPIRYLAIQCLCMIMHFGDAFSDQMVELYVGTGPIWGGWEDRNIDYRLLKLWEEKRWKDLSQKVVEIQERSQTASAPSSPRRFTRDSLSSQTADVGGILLPRSGPLESTVSTFVLTPTAKRNLHQLGSCLLEPRPVLLCGPAGSSKTSLVHEAARLLNKLSSMVTLHINEQTDAKSLLGVYTSSSNGSSFTWKAGVLTKAIQEGRWVLIEDIDRAPAEVMGVLRPILEDGELFLPNRKERVLPKDGFRIIATLKKAGRYPFTATSRHSWLLSPRLWSLLEIGDYDMGEVEFLLRSRYPTAAPFTTTILRAHDRVCALYRDEPRLKALQTRSPSLRDLLKWSRRAVKRLRGYQQESVPAALPEAVKLQIFNDAVDCYAGYLNDDHTHDLVASCLAREMGISPQQMRHCLNEAFTTISETSSTIRIGRSTLEKVPHRRRQTNKTPFALTSHAQRTLGRISAGVSSSEPCLLVGETGVGKTTLVQYVAGLVGQTLTVVNLSQQSEASDLLGGLKPVTTRALVLPLVEKFNVLFEDTFSAKRNEKFQMAITKAVARQTWQRLVILWNEAIQMAASSLNASLETSSGDGAVHASKRRKLTTPKYQALRDRWSDFSESLNRLRPQIDHGEKTQTFAFVEGRLVQAVRDGEWVLLDEINLAAPDTLDHIVSLLHNGDDEKPALLLTEAGNIESVVAHPNFRVFAAMNPATDAGKKDLPPGLRSRFTEISVSSGDSNIDDLTKIIQTYLGPQLENDKRAALDLAKAYKDLKQLNQENKLTDGAGDIPHFSIRSLVRCLMYVSQHSASHGLRRSMYEGFAMSFFTVLSRTSENLALPLLEKHLLSNVKNKKSFLNQQPKMPFDGEQYISFRHHLVKRGPMTPDLQPHYIRTASVERNLVNLARAASMRRFPILLQGPTSAGKTSMVEYLAKLSGNKFVRINNHEHTDLQEYLGSYVSDAEGKLVYREGVLVDALRRGHWIVLDELNLAPSDVLEALNRLLDDNRELLIPESQEIVRPHPSFMLFATQNPAGLYGGRKRLSRAFRNRFLELHFDDIPEEELEIILRERAQIAPSFCAQIVAVYKKLSLQRQSARLFEQRNSFATLRDLFRWAARPMDDRQQLANQGFMLLAERVRDPAERAVVKKSIEETMKVTIDERSLYGMSAIPPSVHKIGSIVWTSAMRRLFVLVSEALRSNEPVLLVGETGCGKTQICQVVSEAFGRPLRIYNAHTNTETGDLIGSQRPIRNRSELADKIRDSWRALFGAGTDDGSVAKLDIDQVAAEFSKMDKSSYDPQAIERVRSSIAAYQSLFAWSDGSLVRAMKMGEHFLLDEISLADDSVLERLNSVLEPSRTILLAEKGAFDNFLTAQPTFRFLATMNPGGDYGKRELSAALRNRLTEIWVPPLSREADIVPIVQNKLSLTRQHLAPVMLDFATWFRSSFHNSPSKAIPLRDLLAWADFINRANFLDEGVALVQGAFMVYVDSIGANPAGMTSSGAADLYESRRRSLEYLQSLVKLDVYAIYRETPTLRTTAEVISVGPFSLPRSGKQPPQATDLVFDAPTTLQNTMRIVRALQMSRPILLEGSPGVGKTAIVTALAHASGKDFTRINLSDQTDLMDLFGADTPAENEQLGNFSWQNGPLLNAMQSGGWVLLDEMNLASQSVLEGLNSCLDHRREVYIAELDKSFTCHPDFTLFAAQNPHHQGGGRKGLPASFVNRFTVVYADSFRPEDLMRICQYKYPTTGADRLSLVIKTVTEVEHMLSRAPEFSQGGPWELNLRDVDRWLRLCEDQPTLAPSYHFRTIVAQRFRTAAQKELVQGLSGQDADSPPESFYSSLAPTSLQIGTAFLSRDDLLQRTKCPNTAIPVAHLPAAKSVATAIKHVWPVILSGPSGSGKSSLIRSIAAASGAELVEFSMNADVDTMDLVGGFEQFDVHRDVVAFQNKARAAIQRRIAVAMRDQSATSTQHQLLILWEVLKFNDVDAAQLPQVLSSALDFLPEGEGIKTSLSDLLNSTDLSHSRFVWNDGILVDALERGAWLVLDNANLCNPSVLDRLNSLLEPDGFLSVSEQHNAGTEPRLIRPHPNFRIFLTMDPQYGELSRAMRNRSLEIYMPVIPHEQAHPPVIQYPCASAVARLRHLLQATSEGISQAALEAFADNLSIQEMGLALENLEHLPADAVGPTLAMELSRRKSLESANFGDLVLSPSHLGGTRLPQLITLNEPWVLLDRLRVIEPLRHMPAEILTRGWYLSRRAEEIMAKLREASAVALTVPTKGQTILQRSTAVANGKKMLETVPQVAAFASRLISELSTSLKAQFTNGADFHILDATERMLLFIQDVVQTLDTKTLDLPLLNAYLHFGADLARSLEANFQGFAALLLKCLPILSVHQTGLDTGLGLQLMWKQFQPKVAKSLSQFETQLKLEGLIARFDQLCRFLPQSRDSLSALRSKLQDTYISIVESDEPDTSLVALQEAVAVLEEQSQRGFFWEGKFENVLNFIYQVLKLHRPRDEITSLHALEMFIPESKRKLLTIGDEASVAASLDKIGSLDISVMTGQDYIGTDLIKQLCEVREQPLGTIDHAKEELFMLIKATTSYPVTADGVTLPLLAHVQTVVSGMISAHYDFLTKEAKVCCHATGALDLASLAALPETAVVLNGQDKAYFEGIYRHYISPILPVLTRESLPGPSDVQTCLINLSLAGLILMVPDKVFDPAVLPNIAFQQHQRKTFELRSRIDGQKTFHGQIMGQETSLVIRVLEQEARDLGHAASPPAVFRPDRSELASLQELFPRIASIVTQGQPINYASPGNAEWLDQWSSSQGKANLAKIIDRLEHSHRAYDDFVKPITWFLKVLSLGLELQSTTNISSSRSSVIKEIARHTPMLGADPRSLLTWNAPVMSQPILRFLWLEYVGITTKLLGEQGWAVSHDLVALLDEFYGEWKARLSRAQGESESRSRYYTYRGDVENDEESASHEMNEMFPLFDDSQTNISQNEEKYDARTVAVKVAIAHQGIYPAQDSAKRVDDHVLRAMKTIAELRVGEDEIPGTTLADLLPGIFLQMDSELADLITTQSNTRFNIYTDSNMAESQKLFNLVHQVQARFQTILERWPEHAVLAEALSFCREVLHMSIKDPVAKLLTKTEKLYEIVSQWQSVASREWTVMPLVEQLSALIVSWRRLELLSWSRLLDEEQQRHEEDAQAWYFVAYEAIIYNSTRMQVIDEAGKSYCTSLARTLEEFLKTTTAGQYSARLRLLDVLKRLLDQLTTHETQLLPVRDCVSNIIEHYRRYETHVNASLKSGRADLEKALIEQIKLASWKDTNVTALRDSARRSHHKLFKIVKKYRDLLNQPVTVFNPSEDTTLQALTEEAVDILGQPLIQEKTIAFAQDQCRRVVTGWDSRPERLTNPLGAVKSMRHLYMSSGVEFQPHLELASYREDLGEAIKELRAQTPSTLTQENGAFVRHLQERKRRLLADTIKAVGQMGIRRNLPTSELELQSSTAAVLSSSPDLLPGSGSLVLSGANSTFHNLLDAMPQVRAARVDHSDDLTEGEINRSVGLLEGLLFLTLQQRQNIALASNELNELHEQISLLRSFHTSPPAEITAGNESAERKGLVKQLAWLREVLILAERILSFQAEQANLEAREFIESMRSYSDRVLELRTNLEGLSPMPLGLQNKHAHTLQTQVADILSQLQSSLKEWQVKEPRLELVIRQIIPWTEEVPKAENGTIDGVGNFSIESFDQDLRKLLDLVFVALQTLSYSQAGLPKTVEDPGWLSKTESHVARAVRSLQAKTIGASLKSLLDRLHCFEGTELMDVRNLLLVASPIIEQYSCIQEHLHRRQAAIHLETCQVALQLAKSFTTLANQGFCRPSETADGEEQSGKLESGTGLGEGEAAEDISKDVGDDEDLSELAQSGQKEEQEGEIEDAEDAIDMGHDDLQGEMGDQGEQESGQDENEDRSDEEGDNEIEEETGSVDDLDPSAVDEKMWDDMMDESEKDKEMKNDKAQGQKSDDQTAAEGQQSEGEDMEGLDGEDIDEQDAEEGDGAERPEAENMDPHLENEKALDLPEELQLNGEDETKDDDISDDGIDELSDIDKPAEDEVESEMVDETEKQERQADDVGGGEEVEPEEDELDNGAAQDDVIMEDQPAEKEDEEQADHDTREDYTAQDMDETAGAESGAANEVQESIDSEQNMQGVNQSEKEPDPQQSQPGKASENQEQGESGTGAIEQGTGRADTLEHQQNEALKKLADVLDQYHQRRQILPSTDDHRKADQDKDLDMADVDLEHVEDEAEGDAQALGAAAADQAQNLDKSQAIEDEDMAINADTDLPDALEPEAPENIAERFSRLQAQPKGQDATGSGGFIPGQDSRHNEQNSPQQADDDAASDDLAPEIEHLDLEQHDTAPASPPTSTSDAAQLWNHCSAVTHQFSLVLTEQLRLILSPTTATKLRGDYRTGKRLNIKRIIPYIASNYKRDKIWMRRAVPSKRSYQIMIAVDDSKSMSESGADVLAFETLAMLTKSLSMLEAGELCVVGFGDQEHITVAHPFGTPFSPAESGPNVFRAFSFAQHGTNVRNLVRQSIQLFRDARHKGHSASEDLWQLQLVVSDGHCSDHEAIARLVRQAQAEKIVIVFVIVDAGPESILDLKEAVFEPDPQSGADGGPVEMRVRTKRYLEDFPFPYYLVVRDVRDLPGILATALKGWFGSVVDVQG